MPVSPAEGITESIGKYDNGCIIGAKPLPDRQGNYEIMRPSRNRYYGHGKLVSFIENFSAGYAGTFHRKLLIGDMGQPRGAVMLTGHASHQIGLDVDIWFKTIPSGENYSAQEKEDIPADFLVNDDGVIAEEIWRENNVTEMLKLASSFPEVERIFVNPKIKMQLCDEHHGEEWLQKIRPWWQHKEHFHVRLYCPKDSPDCVSQAPLPKGDGCDASLAWWDSVEAKTKLAEQKPVKREFNVDKLPERCRALF